MYKYFKYGLGLGVFVALALWIGKKDPQSAQRGSDSKDSIPAQSNHWVLETGNQWLFKHSYLGHGTMNLGGLGVGGPAAGQTAIYDFKTRFDEAELLITVVEIDSAGFKIAFQIPNITGLEFVFAQAQPILEQEIISDLQRPSIIHLNRNSRLKGYEFDKKTNMVSRNMVRQIAETLFPHPESGLQTYETIHGKVYKQQEFKCSVESSKCEIFAKLRRLEPTSRYDEVEASGELRANYEDGSLVKLRSERRFVLSQGGSVVSDDSLTLTFDLISSNQLSASELNQLATLSGSDLFASALLSAAEEYQRTRLDYLRNLIKDSDFDQLVADFSADGNDQDITELREFYDLLLAFSLVDPSRIQDIEDLFDEFSSRDRRFDILSVILAKNGSYEAQLALLRVLDRFQADSRASQLVLMSLALMDNPHPDTVRSLIDRTNQIGVNHRLYPIYLTQLGGVGYQSKDADHKEAIYQMMLNATQSSKLKMDGFIGLGNLGYATTIDFVIPYLSSKDPEERALAAQSLRRINDNRKDEASTILINLGIQDEDESVRKAAFQSLITRDVDKAGIAALEKRLYEERSVLVVLELLEAMAGFESEKSAVHDALKRFYRSCGHPRVCSKVEGLILHQR